MPQIDIQEYRTATAMLADWAEWLEQNAANNNLLLGFLYRLQRREAAGGEVVALMVGISEAGQSKLALFQTAPRELILVCAPTGRESALAAGVEWNVEREHRVIGVPRRHAEGRRCRGCDAG